MSYRKVIIYVSNDGIWHLTTLWTFPVTYCIEVQHKKTTDQNGNKVCFQQPVSPAHYC